MKKFYISLSESADFSFIDSSFQIKSQEYLKCRFLDTFDNKLFTTDNFLFFANDQFFFGKLDSNKAEIISNNVLKDFYKIDDFKNSTLFEPLNSIILNRALLNLFEIQISGKSYQIIDETGNFINLKIISAKKENELGFYFTEIDYDTKSSKIKDFLFILKKAGFDKTDSNFYTLLFDFVNIKKKIYSTKVLLNEIESKDNFGKLAICILRQLTGFVLLNIDGIANDYDIEFLHDFRVSIRRIIVFLKDTHKYIGDNAFEFIESFDLILKNTNHLRDYDVFLQNSYNVLSSFSDNYDRKLAIVDILKHIENLRKLEYEKVVNFLESQFFISFVEKWSIFVEKFDKLTFSIDEVSKTIIFKSIKRIFNYSTDVSPQLSVKKVHKLRIYTKQVRYNLDFYGPFYNNKKMTNISKPLKIAQDYFGSISDLAFYEKFLNFLTIQNIEQNTEHYNYFESRINKEIQNILQDINKQYSKLLKALIKFYLK